MIDSRGITEPGTNHFEGDPTCVGIDRVLNPISEFKQFNQRIGSRRRNRVRSLAEWLAAGVFKRLEEWSPSWMEGDATLLRCLGNDKQIR